MKEFNVKKLLVGKRQGADGAEAEYSQLRRNPWPGGIKRKYLSGKVYKSSSGGSNVSGKTKPKRPTQTHNHTWKVMVVTPKGKKRFITVSEKPDN